ncbi:MAG: hypothetical protein GVY05_01675 [Bacteroidetes bacterium]|jgi:hypothetical protein|nr:hypothetical protein [Bacteroidota bacterium]
MKYIFLFLFSQNIFAQDYINFNHFFVSAEFNFHLNNNVNNKKVGFNFDKFQTNDNFSNTDYYLTGNNEKGGLKFISKYSSDESFSENFEIIVNYENNQFIVYTMGFYKNYKHNIQDLLISPGIYLYDKKKSENYFIYSSRFRDILMTYRSIKFRLIEYNDDITNCDFNVVYLLDSKLFPKNSISFFRGDIELFSNYEYLKQKINIEKKATNINRCSNGVQFDKLSLNFLNLIFNLGINCDFVLSNSQVINKINDLPLWFQI